MRQLSPIALTACLVLAAPTLAAETPPRGEEQKAPPAGLEVFERKNCLHCHSVESEGLTRKGRSEKTRGPDLSSLDGRFTAEQLLTYLLKDGKAQVTAETLDGAVDAHGHWKTFWGSAEDARLLVDWLLEISEQQTTETSDG